ncbi:MAG: hypothetical protein AABX84_01520, partial [Nanoarchaeota archaeon]
MIKILKENPKLTEDIISLGTLNNQIVVYEKSEEFNKFVKSLLPQSEGDVVVSLPDIPYAATMAVVRAGVRQGIRTFGKVALKHGLGGLDNALAARTGATAVSGSSIALGSIDALTNVDNAIDLIKTGKLTRLTGVPVNQGGERYLLGIKDEVSRMYGLSPEGVKARTFDRLATKKVGEEKELVQVTVFYKIDEAGKEVPFLEGVSHVTPDTKGLSSQEQVIRHLEGLKELEELGLDRNHQFKGAFSHIFLDKNKNPVDGFMVLREYPREVLSSGNPESAFKSFEKSISHLDPKSDEYRKAIEAYNKCCR